MVNDMCAKVERVQQLGMVRTTPFSYLCGRCSRCCYHKGISLNPYEVLRLARNQGVTTTQFIRQFTDTGGTQLQQRDDGACVFLGEFGCGVHADRPLVCRIYPLSRHISAEGVETFSELQAHPQTAGEYGIEGTIAAYLGAQGAAEYLLAADRYLDLFRMMAGALSAELNQLTLTEQQDVMDQYAQPREDAVFDADWLDIDGVVDKYCVENGVVKPAQAEQLLELHLKALAQWSIMSTIDGNKESI